MPVDTCFSAISSAIFFLSCGVYFNVQFYTKCEVLNPFVQFLKHKCAVTKLTKIALIKTVFSFTRYPSGYSREFQKCCHYLRIKNINVFWGRTPDPPIFLTNHLRAGVIEKKVKLGRPKLPKRD